MLKELVDLDVSAKQIQRISESYGQKLEELAEQAAQELEPPATLSLKQPAEPVYVMVDGSMVYLRQKGWSEMKLGRLFTASSVVAVQPQRSVVLSSLYVCHLGDHQRFTEKLEAYGEPYRCKVFICDGAKWIWSWVEDAYPEAVQILDFYHAIEKLAAFCSAQYTEVQQRREWLEQKREQLLGGGVEQLIAELEKVIGRNGEATRAKEEVLCYYQNNKNRMRYDRYRQQGLLIGSGPVEAAHRTVVQQRLKRSGQRWSREGAQQIVNLRACRKSNQWNTLVNLIKNAA